jgi:hypothetical protein
VRHLVNDEPLACKLGGGGTAFVAIGKDGKASLELALEPAVAAVRTGPVPEDLVRASRALERLEEDVHEDDDETTAGAGSSKVRP